MLVLSRRPGQSILIGKDEMPKLGPVDLSIGIKQPFAERIQDGLVAWRAF